LNLKDAHNVDHGYLRMCHAGHARNNAHMPMRLLA